MSTTETFILIPGRTSRQGAGISEGKFKANYQEEINTLQVAPADMKRMGLADGDRVRLQSAWARSTSPSRRPSRTSCRSGCCSWRMETNRAD